MANYRSVYFDGFIKGINNLYPIALDDNFGKDYLYYNGRISEARQYRNKIFHGQTTGKGLSRQTFERIIGDLKFWCENLSDKMKIEFDFSGFERNSFRKKYSPKS